MGITKSSLFDEASGTLGNIIFYKVGNQIRFRGKPEKYRDKKSPAQVAHRTKIKAIADLYGEMDLYISAHWDRLAAGTTLSGYNLFMRENIRNITGEGVVADLSLFKICIGPIPLPRQIKAVITPDRKIEIEWDTVSTTTFGCDDLLQIATYAPLMKPGSQISVIASTRTCRKKGYHEFNIPDQLVGPLHFYAFFKSDYTNDVSVSHYLGSQPE